MSANFFVPSPLKLRLTTHPPVLTPLLPVCRPAEAPLMSEPGISSGPRMNFSPEFASQVTRFFFGFCAGCVARILLQSRLLNAAVSAALAVPAPAPASGDADAEALGLADAEGDGVAACSPLAGRPLPETVGF